MKLSFGILPPLAGQRALVAGLAANLDFFVSFEEDKKMFLRKYTIRDEQHRFTRSNSVPVIKDLFSRRKASGKQPIVNK